MAIFDSTMVNTNAAPKKKVISGPLQYKANPFPQQQPQGIGATGTMLSMGRPMNNPYATGSKMPIGGGDPGLAPKGHSADGSSMMNPYEVAQNFPTTPRGLTTPDMGREMSPPPTNFPKIGGVDLNPEIGYIQNHNAQVDDYQRRMAGMDEQGAKENLAYQPAAHELGLRTGQEELSEMPQKLNLEKAQTLPELMMMLQNPNPQIQALGKSLMAEIMPDTPFTPQQPQSGEPVGQQPQVEQHPGFGGAAHGLIHSTVPAAGAGALAAGAASLLPEEAAAGPWGWAAAVPTYMLANWGLNKAANVVDPGGEEAASEHPLASMVGQAAGGYKGYQSGKGMFKRGEDTSTIPPNQSQPQPTQPNVDVTGGRPAPNYAPDVQPEGPVQQGREVDAAGPNYSWNQQFGNDPQINAAMRKYYAGLGGKGMQLTAPPQQGQLGSSIVPPQRQLTQGRAGDEALQRLMQLYKLQQAQ